LRRSGARYAHDTHQEHTQLLPELCGRADPPELYPGRADVKLVARMLCMPPSVTLSIEPCSVKVTPSIAYQIVPHAEAASSGKVIVWYILPLSALCDTLSALQHPDAAESPVSGHFWRDIYTKHVALWSKTVPTVPSGHVYILVPPPKDLVRIEARFQSPVKLQPQKTSKISRSRCYAKQVVHEPTKTKKESIKAGTFSKVHIA
jgi:hypothetical protein